MRWAVSPRNGGIVIATEERRIDGPLRERLDEIEEGYTQRANENAAAISSLRRGTFWVLAVLVVIQLGVGVVTVVNTTQNDSQNDDIARTVAQNAATVRAIQQQRAEAVWDGCRSSNYRHENTIGRINAAVDKIKDPAEKARAVQQTATTVGIIDALTPAQDCKAALAIRLHLQGKALDRLTARLTKQIGPAEPPPARRKHKG